MRSTRIRDRIVPSVIGLILVFAALSAAADENERTSKLIIKANPDAPWGGQIKDVEKVLYSAAEPLWKYFPDRELKPILVEPKGGPITLYERGPAGEIQVRLNTGDRLWAQQAFQFAHELGHILCNYKPGANRNKWFEESVCELASLFALRRMSEAWQTAPPYPNWKSYAPSLANYAEERLKAASLPSGTTLGDWYLEYADQLAQDHANRNRNLIVASVLLPLFEKQPQHWEAVTYLNDAKPRPSQTFAAYLNDWYLRCPRQHQSFVEQIARQFEITIPIETGSARDQIQAEYDKRIEALTKEIVELRKQRDAELKKLFQQEQKRRGETGQ